MKKFIINISLFTLCLLIINIGFYSIVYNNYFAPYENVSRDYHIYLLADSHGASLKHFTDKYRVCNFSADGDSYYDMFRKIRYLKDRTNLKMIIISADDHSLSPYREKANNLDRSIYLVNENNRKNIFLQIKLKLKRYIVLASPKGRDITKAYLMSKIVKKKKSFVWSDMPDVFKISQSHMRYNYQFLYDDQSSNLLNVLDEIITVCESNDIKLVGIKYPLDKNYINVIGDKNFGADILLRNRGVKVYDFKDRYIKNDYYFKNQDHLNDIGGKAFAKVLNETILQ